MNPHPWRKISLAPVNPFILSFTYFNLLPTLAHWASHSSILAWRIPWTEEPGGLQSMGPQRVGHDWATELTTLTLTHRGSLVPPLVWSKPNLLSDLQYLFGFFFSSFFSPSLFLSLFFSFSCFFKIFLRTHFVPGMVCWDGSFSGEQTHVSDNLVGQRSPPLHR